MKVCISTLGCRVNQAESDELEELLKENGVTISDLKDNPDFCVINTCSVTAKSDQSSRQLIRKAAKTGAKVIVTGCYSQLNPQMPISIAGAAVVDIRSKNEIAAIITGVAGDFSFGSASRSRPFLKVQDGCNFNCSYCTVPLARGRSRSVHPDIIVSRAKSLAASGVNEVVLTGIHLGSYGHDLEGRLSLSFLLKRLLAETSIHRIRLSSIEINEIDSEMIDILRNDRICRNLHVPLQSGSSRILSLMRRTYDADIYRGKMLEISSALGDISFGTDVIVGFPGEEDSDHMKTVSFIESLPFTYLHVFPYSKRPGTDAAGMAGAPLVATTKERVDRLIRLGNAKKMDYMSGQIGKQFEIIMEVGTSGGRMVGTSSNYLKISVPGDSFVRGSLVIAESERIKDGMLEGLLIKEF